MNYVMELREFPDGIEMTPRDKAIAFVLAHHHNPEQRITYPGRDKIALAACCDVSTVKRALTHMERHLLIHRARPDNQGRGQFTKYFFLALDAPLLLERLLLGESFPEGVQLEPFFSPGKSGSKGVQTASKSGSEGVQRGPRNKERTGTVGSSNLTTSTNQPVEVSAIDFEALRGRLSEWLGIDGRRTRQVSVDDHVVHRLVERCTAADALATTDEILLFINEKGPSLLEKRVTSDGCVYERKAGIQYPAMFLVAAVASCFDGPNSASRRRRVQETR